MQRALDAEQLCSIAIPVKSLVLDSGIVQSGHGQYCPAKKDTTEQVDAPFAINISHSPDTSSVIVRVSTFGQKW